MTTKENVKLYICDFCKKKSLRKHSMLKHEDGCVDNPKNKIACFSGCAYLENVDLDFEVLIGHHWDGEGILSARKSTCYKCIKKDQLMYTFAAEKRDLPNKYPDEFEGQQPMPKITCPDFKDNLPF